MIDNRNNLEDGNTEDVLYSRSILSQSIPSLLISFIGFTIAGLYLKDANYKDIFQIYPLLLVSTCILSFKGNIELIFAMHLSSVSHTSNILMEYAQFAINNSCTVINQSIMIGAAVGLVGSSMIVAQVKNPIKHILVTLCTCVFSCFVSTLLVLMILFIAITIVKNFEINPDNVVLPSISAFSDYFTVCSLIFFFETFHNFDSIICYIGSLLFIISLFPLIAYIARRSQNLMPISSIFVLFFTFLLSSTAGLIIEHFSDFYSFLAASSTVFCGLTSGTSFIYLNRKLTSVYNHKPLNKRASLFSLLLLSLAMSLTYILVSNTLFVRLSYLFSFLFIISFLIDVYLLIELIDFIFLKFQRSIDVVGIVALPLITSVADLFGSCFLVCILSFSNALENHFKK